MQPDTVASSASVRFVMTMCVLLASIVYGLLMAQQQPGVSTQGLI